MACTATECTTLAFVKFSSAIHYSGQYVCRGVDERCWRAMQAWGASEAPVAVRRFQRAAASSNCVAVGGPGKQPPCPSWLQSVFAAMESPRELSVRELREQCKRYGITCRGNRAQVLARLHAHLNDLSHRAVASTEPTRHRRPETGLKLHELYAEVLPPCERPRQKPERFSPSPSDIMDDDESGWTGISLDSSDQGTDEEGDDENEGRWAWKVSFWVSA